MAVGKLEENHASFEELSNAGDIDGLLEMYTEDAVYVAGPGRHLRGRAQIRSGLEQLGSVGTTRLELVDLVEVGDLAYERTRWTTEIPGENGETTEMSGDSTVVLRREADGKWRILVDDPGLGG